MISAYKTLYFASQCQKTMFLILDNLDLLRQKCAGQRRTDKIASQREKQNSVFIFSGLVLYLHMLFTIQYLIFSLIIFNDLIKFKWEFSLIRRIFPSNEYVRNTCLILVHEKVFSLNKTPRSFV